MKSIIIYMMIGFNAIFIHLQIAHDNLKSQEDFIASHPILNLDCRNNEFPANGDCDDGWYVLISSTHIELDETASLDCQECKILNKSLIFFPLNENYLSSKLRSIFPLRFRSK